MTVGILLLAAGRGRRFGSDKRLARLADGSSLLEASVGAAQRSGLPLLVALASRDSAAEAVLEHCAAPWVYCPRAAHGMGYTIAEASAQLPAWNGALIALADMPRISPETYRLVAKTTTPAIIVQPCFRGQPGHPVGFGSQFFGRLQSLRGDQGARTLMSDVPEAVVQVSVGDPNILRDVDTPADLDLVNRDIRRASPTVK